MFKLESYITPIILNYVAKYVKNIRPQDSQVSLWEGEVAFQNLDLRLDVLEEELQLPFEFLSGHIHELTIHVPWTKINSEPINITINTIEFVLKLKDQSAQPPPQERKKRASRVEDLQQGYIPGLVNKIINNIAINCHNIILKYVEDDIVVSMNIQLLSMSSADENWQKCFADLNPMKVILRKLVQISDMTICLDKRNEMGQIEVCQEPILYRCSLEIRILRKYNAATAATASITMVHLFSKSMDINVSSLQFPMVMRLLALVLALKSGDLKSVSSMEVLNEAPEDSEGIAGAGESYLSWAWNLLPNILTTEPAPEDTESSEGHFLDIASYVEVLKFTLKSSEFITETIVQTTKKIRYNPIFRATLKGIFSETVMSDSKWFNTKAGVASVFVEPLGNYGEAKDCPFISNVTEWNESYLNESLFDSNSKENTGKPHKYVRDVATYLVENSMANLQFRGPAMAFDMVHTPEEKPSEIESKAIAENLIMRASLSSVTICWNSSLFLVMDVVQELIDSYNYPPYVEEKQTEPVPAKLPPPSVDEYDDLMSSDIPKRHIELLCSKITIHIHSMINPLRNEKAKQFQMLQNKKFPWFAVKVYEMHGRWTTPLHPNTLVFTTCQLPTKPQELLDSCYDLYKVKLKKLSLNVADTEASQCILRIPSASAEFGAIIQPDLWTSQDDVKYKLEAQFDSIITSYTRPQLTTAMYLVKTLAEYNYDALMDLSGSTSRKSLHEENPKLEHDLNMLSFSIKKYIQFTCCSGALRYAQSCLITSEDFPKNFIFTAPPDVPFTANESFCHWNVQVPNEFGDENLQTVVAVRISNFIVIVEPALEKYLKCKDIVLEMAPDANIMADVIHKVEKQRTSRTSLQTDRSRKVANPEETIHLSSEKEEKIENKSKESILINKESASLPNLLYLKNIVVCIDIDNGSVFIPSESSFLPSINLNQIDYVLITLPSIKIKSAIAENIENLMMKTFPQKIKTNSGADTFPWTCDLINLNIMTNMSGVENLILNPVKTSITAALTHKKIDPKQPGTLAFNIHIDTAPIHAILLQNVAIFFFERLHVLQNLISLLTERQQHQMKTSGDKVRVILHDEDDDNIKDFLATQAEPQSSNISLKPKSKSILKSDMPLSVSFWLQWTVAKLRLDIVALLIPPTKLTFELEDFITSIDKQVEYFKLKNKIGTLSLNYYETGVLEAWKPSDSIKLLVNTEGSKAGEAFFDLTITQAETMNVFNKLGAQKNAYNLHKSITEIVANIQAVDLLLDIDSLSRFVPIFCALQGENSKETYGDDPFSVADLPLVYLQSKGVTLYMPLSLKDLESVFIFKVGGIKISPNVENPLNRITVRQDIYNKAAQLRMLHTPGSKVEDRQYELIFNDISAATGKWHEVLSFLKKDSNGTFHNKNPAVEWNNQKEKKPPTLELMEMFSNFIVSITYAPCIVYNKIVVSGQALEFNCLTDLVVSLTNDQLVILVRLLSRLEYFKKLPCKEVIGASKGLVNQASSNMFMSRKIIEDSDSGNLHNKVTPCSAYKDILMMSNIRKGIKITHTAEVADFLYPDSGVALSSSQAQRTDTDLYTPEIRRQNDLEKERKIPSEISFVAGVFIFKLFFSYQMKIPEVGTIRRNKTSEPLLTCTVNQPSMMIAQKIYDSFQQFSIYDISIILHTADKLAGKRQNLRGAQNRDSVEDQIFFETQPGPVTLTGITPPLLWVKLSQNIYNSLEIDCNLLRPAVLNVSHSLLKSVFTMMLVVERAFADLHKPALEQHVPIVRGKKINRIRKMFFNASRINVVMEKFTIQAVEKSKYDLNLMASDLKLKLKFSERPDKFQSTFSAGAISIAFSDSNLLHPFNFSGHFTITKETWQAVPVVVGKVNINVIHMDIGPENLSNLADAWQHFDEVFNEYNNERNNILTSKEGTEVPLVRLKLEEIPVPKFERNSCTPKPKEEFYQDDLRAGAFQFIVCDNDNELPMAYQIQIILKNNGIICWRYPQPRRIIQLRILPIPMESKKPTEILCRMEYYNEASQNYQYFCEFNVSETEAQTVDIPKRNITANIWRVVILQSLIIVNGQYFECACSSDEDEDDISSEVKLSTILNTSKTEMDFRLNPKSLVACMRVDTSFHPNIVPTMQAVIKFNLIQLNLQNQCGWCSIELPSLLRSFKVAEKSQNNHTFATFILSNLELYGAKLGRGEYKADLDMTASCKVLDYSYLNMLYLLEESNIKAQLNFCNRFFLNSTVDTLKLNMGPSMLYTLEASRKHWERTFQKKSENHPILAKYLLVNRTNLNLMFGQVDTKERITLKPLEISLYSFRSDYSDQKLVFGLFVDERVFIRSDPISVDDETVQYVRIAEYVLIVRTKKLSKLQISILIRGQVDLVSMVNEELRVHLKISGKSETSFDSLILPSKAKMGFCAKLMNDTEMTIRLKFRGTANKGWSGEVPLRANKNLPWLVKVPKIGSDTYLSYWVRVIRENISEVATNNFQPQRVLVIIWPMFVLRSMLTTPVEVKEATTNTSFIMAGHGERISLSIPGNHETEHKISIQKNFVSPHGEDKNTAKLTFKTIDWNKFFWFDEKYWTVETVLDELGKELGVNWPSSNEEELHIERLTPENEKTTPIYRCSPSQDFSCALMLEVSAWALFINSLGTAVQIREHSGGGNSLIIESNFISMMFMVKKAFTLRIPYGSSWACSDPIYIYDHPKDHSNVLKRLYLEDVGSLIITLRYGKFVSKILLTSTVENGYRLFSTSPVYIIANFSKFPLKVFNFCMAEGEDIKKSQVEANLDTFLTVPTVKKDYYSKGTTLDSFQDLNVERKPRNLNTAYTFFVCLKLQNTVPISIPLVLLPTFNRKCFTLQMGSESLALCACVVAHKSQYFLSIYDDPCPAINILNDTNLVFYIGQPVSLDPFKATRVIKETEDFFSGWYQVLPAKSQLYYSPPDMYASFPDIESHFGKLTLALVSVADAVSEDEIKWSKPLRTDVSTEKYFNVPLHGDVKLIVCDKHRTARICLFYSKQKTEFCVKDLRSRLTNIGLDDSDLLFSGEQSSDSTEIFLEEKVLGETSQIEMNLGCLSRKLSSCSHLEIKEILTGLGMINCNIFVKEMNFNFFIDTKEKSFMKTEIISVYVDDFIVQFDAETRNCDIMVSNLQVDNQLFSSGNYDFPVILCPEELYKRSPMMPLPHNLPEEIEKRYKPKPLISIRIKYYDEENYIESVQIRIRPIRTYLEDTYLHELHKQLVDCLPQNMVYELKTKKQRINLPSGAALLPRDIINQVLKLSEVVRFRSVRIEHMSVLISIHTSVSFYIAVDHSPLQFSSFEKKDLITLVEKLEHAIEMHYLSEFLFGAGWVVGSLEILGSPSGLARSFSIGLRDFVSLPVQGLLRGPWGFVVGVTQGSASLLRNVTAGTVNSVTKLASSLARNLDRLTLDQEHLQRTDALRRLRPQGFAEGFSQGLTGFGISLLGAVGGLARHPLEAKSSVQVVTGVGKGIVGALAKPISGAAELVALTGQGVLHTVGFNAMPMQRFSTVTKNATVHLADCKISKLLPGALSRDPVLFFHEATLVLGDQLKRAIICMTKSVFTVIDIEKDDVTEIIPIEKIEATFDNDDSTLIHLHVNLSFEDTGEEINFTNQRIMNFLKSSEITVASHFSGSNYTIESSVGVRKKKLDCSFYMSEHLGQHLLNYLKILNKNVKDAERMKF